jgi:hypothetical protein
MVRPSGRSAKENPSFRVENDADGVHLFLAALA